MSSEKTSQDSASFVKYADLPPSLEEMQLGVWRVILEKNQSFKIPQWKDVVAWCYAAIASIAHLAPFVKDVYFVVGPLLALNYVVAHLWNGIQEAVYLYLPSNLLSSVSFVIS